MIQCVNNRNLIIGMNVKSYISFDLLANFCAHSSAPRECLAAIERTACGDRDINTVSFSESSLLAFSSRILQFEITFNVKYM